MGGWSFYAKDGKLKYCYNFFGIEDYLVGSDGPIPAGEHELRMRFKYDGGGLGKGADITLYVDGKEVGKGRVERTHGYIFSMDETTEIGCDKGEPVSTDYDPRDNEFNGKVKWVQIDIDAAAKDVDHMIGAEERFQLAVARQ